MFIRPLRLPSDRAALSEFLEVQARRGLPVLSENKHALIEYGDDRPGTGLVAETEHGAIAAYLGLAPAADGGWAMEIVTAEPDPTPLVDAAVREVGERGGGQLRWWIYGGPLVGWPERLGFTPERRLLVMARDLPADEEPQFPEDTSVLPFRPGLDEEAWLTVNNAAFRGHPENGDQTRADLERRMAMDWFDPAGLRMAWAGERLAGFCWTKIHPSGEGEIYIIGLHPDFQGRGLGRPLVLEGFRHLSDRGCPRVFLYTEGDNEAAVRLYEKVGMQVVKTHRSYLRQLT
ncbi:MAG TPA: mycothiol synthase [Acidimicrobiia bacterium]|jgi:mycothiol synthase